MRSASTDERVVDAVLKDFESFVDRLGDAFEAFGDRFHQLGVLVGGIAVSLFCVGDEPIKTPGDLRVNSHVLRVAASSLSGDLLAVTR